MEPVENVKKKTNTNLLQKTIRKCALCGKRILTQNERLMIENMKTVHNEGLAIHELNALSLNRLLEPVESVKMLKRKLTKISSSK